MSTVNVELGPDHLHHHLLVHLVGRHVDETLLVDWLLEVREAIAIEVDNLVLGVLRDGGVRAEEKLKQLMDGLVVGKVGRRKKVLL